MIDLAAAETILDAYKELVDRVIREREREREGERWLVEGERWKGFISLGLGLSGVRKYEMGVIG